MYLKIWREKGGGDCKCDNDEYGVCAKQIYVDLVRLSLSDFLKRI